MSRIIWTCAVVLMAFAGTASADEKKEPAKANGLDRMKKLAGEWYAADDKGKPTDKLVSVFKVTAAGSAVQETIFPGDDHEMVTLYHMDGADLVLTHYCAFGNQPKLKLDPKSPENQLLFKFVGGTNLNADKDMHMHEGNIKIIDDDHIEWNWQGYCDGKADEGHKVAMKLVRKKR